MSRTSRVCSRQGTGECGGGGGAKRKGRRESERGASVDTGRSGERNSKGGELQGDGGMPDQKDERKG